MVETGSNNNFIQQNGRVIIVEPNAANGEVNGVPLTPDYTDYCISVRLMCEIVNRKRNMALDKNNAVRYMITSGKNRKWASFLSGRELRLFEQSEKDFQEGNHNSGFLTTYYTDISQDDILRDTEVEGLGMESIQIAFESYYTPTVTIKFVDHRGSAIFGREEAIHESDKITVDTIFGAFFTQPYPLFRLQVKGFYGQAVTLQLICSGFKGSFNAQTGNFEAIATFIGYSYSLLTDIPFHYLVAAPYCRYVGASYWDQKRNSPAWRLYDDAGYGMMKLGDFFELLTSTLNDSGALAALTNDQEKVISTNTEETAALRDILQLLAAFIESMRHGADSNIANFTENMPIDDEQILLMSSSNGGDNFEYVFKDSVDPYNKLVEAIETYNTKYGNQIGKDKLPNQKGRGTVWSRTFIEVFNIDEKGNVNIKDGTPLKEQKLNDNLTMSESLVEKVMYCIENEPTKIRKYCYLLNLYDLRKFINERMGELENSRKLIVNQAEREYVKIAKAKLKMVPYIGNLFKMIMAHLETLVQMMFHCFQNIKTATNAGLRKFDGIDINFTDIVGKDGNHEDVVAWPMVTRRNDEEGGETIEWLGKYKPDYEEVLLVRSLYNGLKRITKESEPNADKKINIRYLPVLPLDIINIDRPVFESNGVSISLPTLAGMLGFRIAQIIYASESNSTAKVFYQSGVMDAYNFFLSVMSRGDINENIIQALGDKNFADTIIDIMCCEPDADTFALTTEDGQVQYHPFETCKLQSANGRHPMFKKANDQLQYVHYEGYSINDVERQEGFIVPMTITENFDRYKDLIIYNSSDKFTYQDSNIKQLLVASTTHIKQEIKGKILNRFKIITNQNEVNSIINHMENIKNGNIKMADVSYNESNLQDVVDYHWGISDDYYKKVFLKDYFDILSPRYFSSDEQITASKLVEKGSGGIFEIYYESYYGTILKPLNYKSNGTWIIKDENTETTINDLCIPLITIEKIKKTDEHSASSLTLSDLYILQNDEHNKAYLFLMALCATSYNLKEVETMCQNGVCNEAYGKWLCLGAAEWRRRQKNDPIKKTDDIWIPGANYWPMFDGLFGYTNKSNNIKYHQIQYNLYAYEKDYVISLFEDFVNKDWPIIRDNIELSTITTLDQLNQLREEIKQIATQTDDGQFQERYKSLYSSKLMPSDFDTKFYFIYGWQDGTLRLHLNDTNTAVQNKIKEIITKNVLVVKNDFIGNGNILSLKTDSVKRYLNGFIDTIRKICSPTSYATQLATENIEAVDSGFTDDIAISIYYYLKSLWDKWLIASHQPGSITYAKGKAEISLDFNEYSVEHFFKNFIFIDAFYRNISNRFMINCQSLLSVWDGMSANQDKPLFGFIGDVLQKHNCLFLALPDFIDDLGEGAVSKVKESLTNIFKPIPYENLSAVRTQNKFVIIYNPKFAENASEINNFRYDGFDILESTKESTSSMGNDSVLPMVLQKNDDDVEDEEHQAYYVPAFLLSYGKQNQHIFTNLQLNMETPIITSAVIATMTNILSNASNAQHQINYVGQDLFPVFSNYSYICEFDMMGCAQIMPLMYFQLLNIPMWKGTYMIFNVTHTIQAGNMMTHVKAYKLSNKSYPYTKQWFVKNPNYVGGKYIPDCGNEKDNIENVNAAEGDWMSTVAAVGKWYQSNVHTYQGAKDNKVQNRPGRQHFKMSINGRTLTVMDDCSAFVVACVLAFGVNKPSWETNAPQTPDMTPEKDWGTTLQSFGFRYLQYSKEILQPGDICVVFNKDYHHAMVFVGNGKEYGWGNRHDGQEKYEGMPSGFNNFNYQHIWRWTGQHSG